MNLIDRYLNQRKEWRELCEKVLVHNEPFHFFSLPRGHKQEVKNKKLGQSYNNCVFAKKEDPKGKIGQVDFKACGGGVSCVLQTYQVNEPH
mmetsp:Transcript_21684/g.50305  ORF Transcript_21684/g.50305 Transcript_21684/m.50305 type:complete len:91 (-) Transcript_21684:586-858(-)